MGGHVFAVTGGSGGVGKTTTVVNLGVALQQAGHDTVVVDADLAMADLGRRLELDCTPGIHGVLAGEAEVRKSIARGPEGLTVLPGSRDLGGFAAADPEQLPKTLELLSVAFDVVLVDTGPGINRETMVTQRAVDGTILVTRPDGISVRDTVKTGRLADQADCPVVGVVVTAAEDERGAAEIADRLETDLLAAVPRHPVHEGEPRIVTHPDSAAATAYHRLATVLPIPDPESPTDDPDEEHAESDDGEQTTGDDTAADDEATTDESEAGEQTAASNSGTTDAATADGETADAAAADGGRPRHVDPAIGN
jgi:septum site-determining protein MinD